MNRDSHDTTVRLMEVFSRLAKADWRKTTKWGIKASEVRVLIAVLELRDTETNRGPTVSDLSKKLQVTSPTVTQIINSLIKDEYILRSIHPTDRRISEITLTEKGEQLVRKALAEYTALFTGLIEHLGREQSEQLVDLLHQSFAYLQEASKKEHV